MIAGISIAVAVSLLMVAAARTRDEINERGGCPACGTAVPKFRRPTSWRQAMWGGWTCNSCGTEMDRKGIEIANA